MTKVHNLQNEFPMLPEKYECRTFPIERRIDGKDPMLVQALAFSGIHVQLIGAVGTKLDPIFADFHRT
jgi:hypothetical protein